MITSYLGELETKGTEANRCTQQRVIASHSIDDIPAEPLFATAPLGEQPWRRESAAL